MPVFFLLFHVLEKQGSNTPSIQGKITILVDFFKSNSGSAIIRRKPVFCFLLSLKIKVILTSETL